MLSFRQNWPIEALLRPIHEYYPAFVHACAAVACLVVPEALLLLNEIAYGFVAIFAARSFYRFMQGRFVARYQNALWRYVWYTIKQRHLPVSKSGLFLGIGFRWEMVHTQRLADIARQSQYGHPPAYYRCARELEVRLESTPVLQHLVKGFSVKSRLNPFKPAGPPDDIGTPHIHAVGSPEGYRKIRLADGQRPRHLGIFGTTGVGKTRAIELLVRQDIAAGHVVVVLDPKGDGALLGAMYDEARRAGREDDFHVFHLGFPEYSSGYSPIATFSRVTEVASRIAEQMPGEGDSRAFREFVWRLVNLIAAAMMALGLKIDYRDVLRYGQNIDPLAERYLEHHLTEIAHRSGAWRRDVADYKKGGKVGQLGALVRYFQAHRIEDPLAESLIKVVESDRPHQDKLVGSLLPLMEKLTTGNIAKLLSPDYTGEDGPMRVFSFPELIRAKGILYVGLDSMVDADVGQAVGNSMFADFTSTLGEIYKHGIDGQKPVICLYADEFAEIVSDLFTQLLNKGRGAGARITVGAQTMEDLIVGFGDEAKALQAVGNINSIMMMAAKNAKTAELLTDKLAEAQVSSTMIVSAQRDSADIDNDQAFQSSNEQRLTTEWRDAIHPSQIASLPPGEAFMLMNGNDVFKIKIPMIDPEGRRVPTSVAEVFELEIARRARRFGPEVRADVPINVAAKTTLEKTAA